MNNIRQGANGQVLPVYMEEILINNYCPYFLKMNMIKDDENYKFNYQTGKFKKINTEKLDIYSKLVLLRSLIILNEKNEEWLIKSENYLIEPELIYCINNCVNDGSVRLLFYPDGQRQNFEEKIIKFFDKICNKTDPLELEIFKKFKDVAQQGDCNRTRLFLDKNIYRMETRQLS